MNWITCILLFGWFAGCRQPASTARVVTPLITSTPAKSTLLPTPTLAAAYPLTIGHSASGLPIVAYQFGDGPLMLMLVGGMHGGYEWNTILLSYELIDYLETVGLPEDISVVVIPAANPDGQRLITGNHGRFSAADVTTADNAPGRFNANDVDLNRNWDCMWQPQGEWRDRIVSGGSAPFSEVESQALRAYLEAQKPALTIFFHSAANGVFTGQCDGLRADGTLALSGQYADAAGYPLFTEFTAYTITGDASDYLNKIGLASFTVELRNRSETDFGQNRAGVEAMITALSDCETACLGR